MLIVEDWAEIRRLRRSEGVSISEIARVVGCSRNTVKAALASVRSAEVSAAAVGFGGRGSSRGSGSCFRRFRGCRRR